LKMHSVVKNKLKCLDVDYSKLLRA